MSLDSIQSWWRRLTHQELNLEHEARRAAEGQTVERVQRQIADQLAALRAERDLLRRRSGG